MTTCHTGLHPANGSRCTSPRSSPHPSKSGGKPTEYVARINYIARVRFKRSPALKYINQEMYYRLSATPVYDMVLKVTARSVITTCADQNSLSQCGWFLQPIWCAFVHVSLVSIFMRAYVCMDVWDDSGGRGVESEWAELFNLRLGWEISQGAMCHGEQAERGGGEGGICGSQTWNTVMMAAGNVSKLVGV